MIILEILLLILIYFISGYIMITLYEKGVSTWGVRSLLISGVLIYIGIFHQSVDTWNSFEGYAIGVIFLTNLVIINPYNKDLHNHPSPPSDYNNSNKYYECPKSSFLDWLTHLLLLSWLFDEITDEPPDDF